MFDPGLKLRDRKFATGTISLEAAVPILNLRVREVGVGSQIIEHLWCQLALVLPHPF